MRRCGDSNSRVTHNSRKALNPFAENSLTIASPFDSELGAVATASLSYEGQDSSNLSTGARFVILKHLVKRKGKT